MRPALLILALALPACQQMARCEQDLLVTSERLRAAEEDNKKLKAQLAEYQAKVDSLIAQLANARDDATRQALMKQLEAERAKAEGGRKGSPSKPCNCTQGDPLCTCR